MFILRKWFSLLFFMAFILPSFHSENVMANEKLCTAHLKGKFNPVKRYPAGRKAGDEDILKFGFESEYTMDRLDGILTHYSPKEEFIKRADWEKMSTAQRVEWFQAHKKELFETTRTAGGLELTTSDQALADFLPKNLIMDDTGNVEIVLPPAETLEDIMHKMDLINTAFGKGSMQATVGLSHDAFFLRTLNIDAEESFARNLGYLNFVHDFDVLDKLSSGYKRWLEDGTKSKLVARSFEHTFLGPMTKMKHDTMAKLLKENTLGNRFDEKYMQKVAFLDSSFKYTGSTSYRPDIATKHNIIILEARDAHSDMEVLTNRLVRNMDALRGDREIFKKAVNFQPFDSVGDFEKFPEETRKFLEELFPMKKNPTLPNEWYEGDIGLAVQVYRNFAFPLRDWSSQIEFLGGTKLLQDSVAKAQKHYFDEVIKIQDQLARGLIDKNKAKALIQKEVSFFSINSGLHKSYTTWFEKNVSSQTTEYAKILERYAK